MGKGFRVLTYLSAISATRQSGIESVISVTRQSSIESGLCALTHLECCLECRGVVVAPRKKHERVLVLQLASELPHGGVQHEGAADFARKLACGGEGGGRGAQVVDGWV